MATTSTTQGDHLIDEDTLAKLRGVGARVRKSVTEGFQRTVSVPADPSFATKRLPFTQTPSFISANDAMRDIFAQRAANKSQKGSSSVPSSPQQRPKRIHAGPDDDSDIDVNVEPLDDDDVNLSDEDDAATATVIRKRREEQVKLQAEKAKREIRPLRRSASRGVATQSLPPSMFRYSHEPAGVQAAPGVANIVEEEDWSQGFGNTGAAPTASLQLGS